MRLRLFWTCLAFLAVALPGARAQESEDKKVLSILATRQRRAVEDLKKQLDDIRALAGNLRQRGEGDKAQLLEQAVAIVTQKNIKTTSAGGATGPAGAILRDLENAMVELARILDERPHATAEAQRLGRKIVDTLDEVVMVLIGEDDLESLEEREKSLRDARQEARALTRRQEDLRKETRSTVDRTPAEKAAEKAARDLEQLEKEIDDLDRKAKRELRAIDEALEQAARIEALKRRQQRLRQETALRQGRADRLTPRINRALAEMDAVAREARKASEESAEKGQLTQLAREVGDLAKRQEEIANEIAARETLERAREAAKQGSDAELRKALEKAAERSPEAVAAALRRAGANLDADPEARAKAQAALEKALEDVASRETLARDEHAAARDVARAFDRTPGEAEAELAEAAKEAREAAGKLEAGESGEGAARKSADALKKAAETLKEAAEAQAAKQRAEARAAAREAAAERAEKAAGELEKLAEEQETRDAGMRGTVSRAAEAAREAAAEMRKSAEAAREGATSRAAEEARAAAERTERAMGELKESARAGADLQERQGRVAEDLNALAGDTKEPGKQERLQAAGSSAKEARERIRKGDLAGAARKQDEVIEELDKLAQEAGQSVEDAAAKHKAALDATQAGSRKAAEKAREIAENLAKGARAAKENDARRRMESAQEMTQEAEKALRRSLRRLGERMPKSAEQDRKAARQKIANARRSLRGLRESHRNVGQKQRDQLGRIGAKQQQLEEDVKRLERRLDRLKERAGIERLQDAQSAMREARQRLEQGDPDEAERAQERAEKNLKEAERELDREERRYRALRQYELLFKLKEELKTFRRTAQGHREWLQKIDAMVREAGRVTRRIRIAEIGELRKQLATLQRDVSEKAKAVEKEGAVVYTYILNGSANDLKEVEAQVSLKEVGLVPQEILGDVVRRLDLAITGLERDLRERQQQQQQQPQQQQGQQPGSIKPSLVPPDAEIRMVMVLQKALNEERKVFFDNRPEFGTRTPSAGEKARLERLYHQQGSLAELFDSLRQSFLGGNEDGPAFPGEEEQR